MTLNFCTVINSFYLARALVMHASLEKVCEDFHLYVFAFDDKIERFFRTHPKKSITVIPVGAFERGDLLKVKPTRSQTEYCWTATPASILFCIEQYKLDHCTYIDADMYFYSDPRVLFQELADKSVLITGHRYTPEYDQSSTSGVYCVQYVTIKNDVAGMEVLRHWKNSCLEWCYNRQEEGKFGDQKYLDEWPHRFKNVHVLRHLGGGVGPWNVQRYDISRRSSRLNVRDRATGQVQALVFYHYHGVKFFQNEAVEYTAERYELSRAVKATLYRPYIQQLFDMADKIREAMPEIANPNGVLAETKPSQFRHYAEIGFKNFLNWLRYIAGRSPRYGVLYSHLHQRKRPAGARTSVAA